MTAKEQTEPTTPAYIVKVIYPVEPNRNKSYTFRDADLLTARQSALQKAQQVVAEKQAHEVIDILIQFLEVDRSTITDQHRVIATVFKQRFRQTVFTKDGKDLMQMDAFTKKSLPPSLFLALELEQGDEACNSPETLWNNLTEVENEAGYYQNNNHNAGFGYVQLEQIIEQDLLAQTEDLTTLFNRTYVVLYDGFAYAASLISHYNDSREHESEILSFKTQFLPPHYHQEKTH